jgi:hypothetical protein
VAAVDIQAEIHNPVLWVDLAVEETVKIIHLEVPLALLDRVTLVVMVILITRLTITEAEAEVEMPPAEMLIPLMVVTAEPDG